MTVCVCVPIYCTNNCSMSLYVRTVIWMVFAAIGKQGEIYSETGHACSNTTVKEV